MGPIPEIHVVKDWLLNLPYAVRFTVIPWRWIRLVRALHREDRCYGEFEHSQPLTYASIALRIIYDNERSSRQAMARSFFFNSLGILNPANIPVAFLVFMGAMYNEFYNCCKE